jgi:hypothetical protein
MERTPMKTQTFWKQQCRNTRRGIMIPLIGFSLVVLFSVVAFVSDIGNVIVVRTTLGAAADAAALAGAGALAESYNLPDIKPIAVQYGLDNVPENYGEVLDESNVTFGIWDAGTKTFTPTVSSPNAVRVVVERKHSRNNAVPYFFAKVMGFDDTEISSSAIAVGANSTSTSLDDRPKSVYVTSTKDLSNVVLQFTDGTTQKFEGLHGYTGNFEGTGVHDGKEIACVWIKSGCNESGEGPGFGERVDYPGDGFTVHGANQAQGCRPHVTATFAATGVEFEDSGAPSPVRLVQ